MKKDHKFVWVDGHWKVRCKVTGGEFYTSLWKKGKVKQNQCACCGVIIK